MDRKNQNLYYIKILMGVINFIILSFLSAVFILTLNKINCDFGARNFLENITYLPNEPVTSTVLIFIAFFLLLGIIEIRRKQRKRQQVSVILYAAEILLCLIIIKFVYVNYNGIILLVIADIVTDIKDKHTRGIFFVIMGDFSARLIPRAVNEMLNYRDKNGKAYSPTYLKTLHGQLSAILNHAVRFYGLKSNAAATAGCMGSEKHKEMLFWTKEEYLKFAEVMMDKPQSYYAFEVLYWCGIREGELLALTPADFDLDKGLLSITKSYQRLKGRDVITDPKTPKSVRVIQMPQFLTDEIRDYLKSLYKVQPDQRIFEVTKSYLHHEMDRGAKEAGVKRIRIHDLRHSHVSLLIEMGFSALAIADRVGHESVDITYKYAHLFPSKQQEMAQKLDMERKEG